MSLTHLWAPWRMDFIKAKPQEDCIFCSLPKENQDAKNLILYRGNRCFVILNKYPYNNGHLMIVPNEHIALYHQVSDEVLGEMNRLAKKAMGILDERYHPQGYNMGMNLGQAAGAGVKDHIHLHIVPRWVGDTNFMPVLGETKCLPQHLAKSFEELADLFQDKDGR